MHRKHCLLAFDGTMANAQGMQTDQSTYVGSPLDLQQTLTLADVQLRPSGAVAHKHPAPIHWLEGTRSWEHPIRTQIC